MFVVECRLAAGEFSAATAIVSFSEYVSSWATMPGDIAPRILGYNYNSQGVAHTVRLVMAPSVGGNADEEIILETPSSTVNSFTVQCGEGGKVVPRRLGFESTAQPPGPPYVAAGTPYVLIFSTTGKAGAATFRCEYTIGPGT